MSRILHDSPLSRAPSALSASDEQTAAAAVRRAREAVWSTLLGYAPFVDVLGPLAVDALDDADDARDALSRLTVAAANQRSSRTNQAAADLEDASRHTAKCLIAAEVDDATAERLVNAVRVFADGERDPDGPIFPRVPRQGRPFRLYSRALERAHRDAVDAKRYFVSRNVRLVMKLAHRFRNRGLSYADLVQEGTLGLIKAVERFDPERGFRFSTYAVWWIRHTLGRAVVNQGREVRVPVHMVAFVRDMERKRTELAAKLDRDPRPEELAKALKVPVDKVRQGEEVAQQGVRSLYTAASSRDSRPLIETLPPDANGTPAPTADEWVVGNEMRGWLRPVVEGLPSVERDIIEKRFGLGGDDPMTLQQIGDEYALSRERIRQLEARALARLRTQIPH